MALPARDIPNPLPVVTVTGPWAVGDRVTYTVATAPSGMALELRPQAMHVYAPPVLLQDSDLLADINISPAAARMDVTLAVG